MCTIHSFPVKVDTVLMLLQKIRNDSSFTSLQGDNESMQRLYELDKHFVPSKQENQPLYY